MSNGPSDNLRGVILDTRTVLSFTEFCRACGVERQWIVEMVEEGVIEPVPDRSDWQFHGEMLLRAQRAVRLVRDLGVNWPGAALALDLLEQLERQR